MIYLNDAIESAVRTVMDFLRFKRNSGVLEIKEYELQNSSDIDYCDSTEFLQVMRISGKIRPKHFWTVTEFGNNQEWKVQSVRYC